MDELRITLLGIGVLIIVGIYLWGMRKRITSSLQKRGPRIAPHLPENEPVLGGGEIEGQGDELSIDPLPKGDGLDDQRLVDVEIRRIDKPDTQATTVARKEPKIEELEPIPEMNVLLTVMAPKGQSFTGLKILEAAEAFDLKLATNGVLNCLADSEQARGKVVFSIAHLREPGVFSLDTIDALSTPGLLLYMQLPGPLEELAAVDLMMTMARHLAQFLDGNVCDERRNKLTTQATVHLRSEVAEFQRRQRLQQTHTP